MSWMRASGIAVLVAYGAWPRVGHTAPAYVVTELGSAEADGSDDTWALGIDGGGDVVGLSQTTEQRVFVWTSAAGIELVEDGAAADNVLHGVPIARSAEGTIVGPLDGGVAFADGSFLDVAPVLGHGSSTVVARDVNDLGRVVGYSGDPEHHALIWDGSESVALAPGAFASEAHGIGNSGIAVGWQVVMDGDRRVAVLFDGGMTTELGTPDGHDESVAIAVSSDGRAVGSAASDVLAQPVGVVWDGGTATVHEDVPCIIAINGTGSMLAAPCESAPNFDPGAWLHDGTEWHDLDDLVPDGTADVVTAHGLDDDGNIAATLQTHDGDYQAVLLIPEADAGTLADLELTVAQETVGYCEGNASERDAYGFRIDVNNAGPAEATQVQLTVDVMAMDVLNLVATPDTGFDPCEIADMGADTSRVTCPLEDLTSDAAGGVNVEVWISTRKSPGIDVVASVTAMQEDPTPFNAEASTQAQLDEEAYDRDCGSGDSSPTGGDDGGGCFLCTVDRRRAPDLFAMLLCLLAVRRPRRHEIRDSA